MEQEIKAHKNNASEITKNIDNNNLTLVIKNNELEKLSKEKEELKASIAVISSELEKLRKKQLTDVNSDSQVESLEEEWGDFSNKLTNLSNKLKEVEKKLLFQVASGRITEQGLLSDSGLKQVEASLNTLAKIPLVLFERIKLLFKGSKKEEREDRLELLDKTGKYADFQAKLATNISLANHLKA